MRANICLLVGALALATLPSFGLGQVVGSGQTETTPAIARETFGPQAEARIPVLPPRVVPPPVVADAVVAERVPQRVEQRAVPTRVSDRVAPAAVVDRPVTEAVVTWWDAFAQSRYGFYDDAYVDDNWYYDYYDVPRPAAAAVVTPASGVVVGYRSSWLYAPAAERGLFSW
jgi:hypothetical protein